MRSPGPAFDLRAALTGELRAAIAELEESEGRPKGVHRCRVRIKRARALARVGRSCAPGLSAVFNDSARSVMRSLAKARDFAALADAARTIAAKSSKREAAALETVAATLDTQRDAAGPIDMDAAYTGLRDLLALAQVWPEASPRQIKRGAKRVIRRARQARRRGYRADESQRRHDWRKREKDRYYAALLLADAWPDVRQRKLGEELGEALGNERDALLLLDRLDSSPEIAGGERACKRARRAVERRRRKLAPRADRLGAKLHMSGA